MFVGFYEMGSARVGYGTLPHGPWGDVTDTTPAFRKRYKYESQLRETEGTTPDACPQQWELATKLDTFDDSRPHIACISHHGVWDVKFLLRSELLIVMGMIIPCTCHQKREIYYFCGG